MLLIMEHPVTGIIKKAKTGFSWTFFFFTALVPLLRGDIKWFLLTIVIGLCTFGIGILVLCFMYNRIYITGLLEKGYKVREVEGGTQADAAASLGIRLPSI
ncbi:MAG: HrgC protein [Lentisphaerota bacterium]